MRTHPLEALAILALVLTGVPTSATAAAPARFGVGVNYKGGQVDWRPSPRFMFEVRYQRDSTSDPTPTSASLVGARAYRLFRPERPLFFLSGIELARITAKQNDAGDRATGFATGAFLGIGQTLGRRFLLTLDMGPYLVDLRGTGTAEGSSELQFIADAAFVFFFR